MAKGGIDRLKRKEGFLPLRKRYFIITEGETERNYFLMIKRHKTSNVAIKCTIGKHPDVRHLIRTSDHYLDENEADELTQCWIVLDADILSATDLKSLRDWQMDKGNSHMQKVAITAPMFEYWLLLHYKLPTAQLDKVQCEKGLKIEDSKYDKPFADCHHLWEKIPDALERACQKEISLSSLSKNGTNLHKLVKQLV